MLNSGTFDVYDPDWVTTTIVTIGINLIVNLSFPFWMSLVKRFQHSADADAAVKEESAANGGSEGMKTPTKRRQKKESADDGSGDTKNKSGNTTRHKTNAKIKTKTKTKTDTKHNNKNTDATMQTRKHEPGY